MIEFRLEISRQYISDAEILLENNRINSAISRAYYASYQAMWSALDEPGEGQIWKHLAIIKHFVRGYWCKPNHPRDAAGLFEHLRLPLRQLYLNRIQADYDGLVVDKKVAELAINTVKETIKIVQEMGEIK